MPLVLSPSSKGTKSLKDLVLQGRFPRWLASPTSYSCLALTTEPSTLRQPSTASTPIHTTSLAPTTAVLLTPCLTALSWCMTTHRRTGWPSSCCVTAKPIAISLTIPALNSARHVTRASHRTTFTSSTTVCHVRFLLNMFRKFGNLTFRTQVLFLLNTPEFYVFS